MSTHKHGDYLYKYYQKMVDSFQTDLSVVKSVNSENIHNLRADIKKIKAFFIFLDRIFSKLLLESLL